MSRHPTSAHSALALRYLVQSALAEDASSSTAPAATARQYGLRRKPNGGDGWTRLANLAELLNLEAEAGIAPGGVPGDRPR